MRLDAATSKPKLKSLASLKEIDLGWIAGKQPAGGGKTD
jgi:hypothetical protein